MQVACRHLLLLSSTERRPVKDLRAETQVVRLSTIGPHSIAFEVCLYLNQRHLALALGAIEVGLPNHPERSRWICMMHLSKVFADASHPCIAKERKEYIRVKETREWWGCLSSSSDGDQLSEALCTALCGGDLWQSSSFASAIATDADPHQPFAGGKC